MKVFIDSDFLVYRVGFGCKDYGDDFTSVVDVLESLVKSLKEKFEDHEPISVISSSAKTFRHDVAVTAVYKGNRVAEKPPYYNEIRQYMMDEMGFVMSPDGLEADDYIGINLNKKTDILASQDKDMLMIPAKLHYKIPAKGNICDGKLVKIRKNLYYFWLQMLMGDVSDNVKAINGIGIKRAEKMLKGIKLKDMKDIVWRAYLHEFGGAHERRFDENARLLWIKRHADKEYYDYV